MNYQIVLVVVVIHTQYRYFVQKYLSLENRDVSLCKYNTWMDAGAGENISRLNTMIFLFILVQSDMRYMCLKKP